MRCTCDNSVIVVAPMHAEQQLADIRTVIGVWPRHAHALMPSPSPSLFLRQYLMTSRWETCTCTPCHTHASLARASMIVSPHPLHSPSLPAMPRDTQVKNLRVQAMHMQVNITQGLRMPARQPHYHPPPSRSVS